MQEVCNSLVEEINHRRLKLLVIVPHQDDEINLAGSMLELWNESSQEAYCCFATNGDFYAKSGEKNPITAKTRLKEALAALEVFSIPQDHVICLGYGDNYNDKNADIYQSIIPVTSKCGYQFTYGVPDIGIDDFRYLQDGRHSSYTYKCLLDDLRDVILSIQADVILVTDYDSHYDHRLVSVAFEKVMGEILGRAHNNYRPLVWKGFCYSTAYNAIPDFFSLNILPTMLPVQPDTLSKMPEMVNPIYRWKNRCRFPVLKGSIVSNIQNNIQFRALVRHWSQRADKHAVRIINSDKVFWFWHTDSLTYEAEFTASSGDCIYLNDFVRWKPVDLFSEKINFANVAWKPDADDRCPWFQCTLKKSYTINKIVFYTSPQENTSLKCCLIKLSNNREFIVDHIEPWGRANILDVGCQKNIQWILFRCLASDGQPMITEFEVYGFPKSVGLPILKIMVDDNFAYHYVVKHNIKKINLGVYQSDDVDGLRGIRLICGEDCRLSGMSLIMGKRFQLAVLRCEANNCYDQIIVERMSIIDDYKSRLLVLHNKFRHMYWEVQRNPYKEIKAILRQSVIQVIMRFHMYTYFKRVYYYGKKSNNGDN